MKEDFSWLPIGVFMDGLVPQQTIDDICEANGREVIVPLKKGGL